MKDLATYSLYNLVTLKTPSKRLKGRENIEYLTKTLDIRFSTRLVPFRRYARVATVVVQTLIITP